MNNDNKLPSSTFPTVYVGQTGHPSRTLVWEHDLVRAKSNSSCSDVILNAQLNHSYDLRYSKRSKVDYVVHFYNQKISVQSLPLFFRTLVRPEGLDQIKFKVSNALRPLLYYALCHEPLIAYSSQLILSIQFDKCPRCSLRCSGVSSFSPQDLPVRMGS